MPNVELGQRSGNAVPLQSIQWIQHLEATLRVTTLYFHFKEENRNNAFPLTWCDAYIFHVIQKHNLNFESVIRAIY